MGKIVFANGTVVPSAWANDMQIRSGYLYGLGTSYLQATDAWDVVIAAGRAIAGNDTSWAMNSAGMTKRVINTAGTGWQAWAAGTGNGAVPTGVAAINDGLWLHVFVIGKSSDDSVDFGVDDSLTAAHLMAGGWDKYRRIGSILIEGIAGAKFGIVPYVQVGEEFLWKSNGYQVYLKDATCSEKVNADCYSPPGLNIMGHFRGLATSAAGEFVHVLMHPTFTDDDAPDSSEPRVGQLYSNGQMLHESSWDCIIDTSQHVRIGCELSTTGAASWVRVGQYGYRDFL